MSALERRGLREVVRRWEWLLLVPVAGVMLFVDEGRAWMMVIYPLALGLQWWAWREPLPLTPLNPAILLLALMTGVSAWVTPDIELSLGKVVGVLLGMMVYFEVARISRRREGWIGELGLYSLVGMGIAAIGLVGTRWFTTKFTSLNALTGRLPVRIRGLPGAEAGIHPNELAGALLWVLPVVVMAGLALMQEPKWFASRSGRGKVIKWRAMGWGALLGVAGLLSGGALVLSQSRGSYLALAASGIVVLIAMLRGRARWWASGLLVAGAVAGAVLVREMGVQGLVNEVMGDLPVGEGALSLNTLNGRMEIWDRAMWAIRDVPLTGLGMNVFRKAIFLLYPTFQVPATYSLAHAHNEVLQAALDLGLPGLVGFLAIYIGAVGMLVTRLKSEGARRLLVLGLLGGLLAHFLYGLTDAVALGAKPGFLFWWMLGMSFGLYHQGRPVKDGGRV